MRSAALFVCLGVVIAANGCGSSSNGTGTAGTGGGAAGTSGAGSGGTSAGGGSGGSSPTGGSGGSSASGGSGGALATCGTGTDQGSGETCNTFNATGPCVMQQVSSGTAPTAGGGTIATGTYNLTSLTRYNAPEGGNQSNDRRETLVVSAVTAGSFTLDQVQVSGSSTQRSHGTVAVTGSMVTFTPTCPPPGDGGDNQGGTAGFTATSSTVTLIDSGNGNGGVQVSVYTKTGT